MNKYLVRFNKSKGMQGRGSQEHAWRIFENDNTEYIVKHFKINVPVFSERSGIEQNDDWNVCCYGFIRFDFETSTAIIEAKNG